MGGGGGDSAIIPENVLDAVNRSQLNMNEVQIHMLEFLSLYEPDVIAELPPLSQAQALLLLVKAASVLLTVQLRCNGLHPDDHPIKADLERLGLYEEKLQRFMALSRAPLRPSTTLNYQAATRFIEHSLPDLSTEQRQSMREISKGKAAVKGNTIPRKRKYQSSEKQSVRSAAEEFLEKAKRELLGTNHGDMKGPLRIDTLEEDEA
ncbi:hypothetical protein MKW94_004754 [Papaver nudicaule]|uniref:Nuclear nucleic acid-binding protein C1D n=1 Tax=Papaver nudicaule TaxID=74823 RepID=A0AA41VGU7_PAPNU|nr:hypothetical protein [Papaver nudicaule]